MQKRFGLNDRTDKKTCNLGRCSAGREMQGEEPLFSCMGLSFEERFGNVAVRVRGPSGRVWGLAALADTVTPLLLALGGL